MKIKIVSIERYVKDKWEPAQEETKESFIDGYKLAQKILYSEEEVFILLNSFNKHTLKLQSLKLGNSFDVKEWFEQFKKK